MVGGVAEVGILAFAHDLAEHGLCGAGIAQIERDVTQVAQPAEAIGRHRGGPQQDVARGFELIGGLARAYPDTLWVLDDGTYFAGVEPGHVNVSAFADFPGLADTFARNEVALWRGRGQQSIIWVPILITEGGEPVWVGRRVDPSPLAEIRSAFEWRVALVVTLLLAAILVVARWRATATDRINRRLSDGVQRMIEHAEPVRFDLPGPQEIRELGERLSSLAAEHAEQVDAARARAEALDRSYRHKSQFLANVSHELRTPLNSILLLSKLLAESPGGMDNAQHRQAGVIHSAAKDLRSLIDDVLELSQIEAGKAHLNLNEASPVQIVAELAELVRPQFDAKRLSFRTETAADLPAAIYTDVDKLRQILKNFLANAAKFTEKGEVVLSATVRSDLDRPSLRFAVRDTGIGIARSQQQLIFEPFRQADGSTSRRFGGTGLGLSISRELTALLDGRIELESEPGHGSTFAVTIPLRHGEGAAGGEPITERVDEVPAGEVVPSANLGLRQVLVVAAAFERLLALTGWIESWGAEVTGAGDAAECFEALDDPPAGGYELLVVDAQGLDAQGLLADLRRHPSGGGLSVVAIGFGRDDDMRVNTVDEPLTAAAVLDAIREFVPESARV